MVTQFVLLISLIQWVWCVFVSLCVCLCVKKKRRHFWQQFISSVMSPSPHHLQRLRLNYCLVEKHFHLVSENLFYYISFFLCLCNVDSRGWRHYVLDGSVHISIYSIIVMIVVVLVVLVAAVIMFSVMS